MAGFAGNWGHFRWPSATNWSIFYPKPPRNSLKKSAAHLQCQRKPLNEATHSRVKKKKKTGTKITEPHVILLTSPLEKKPAGIENLCNEKVVTKLIQLTRSKPRGTLLEKWGPQRPHWHLRRWISVFSGLWSWGDNHITDHRQCQQCSNCQAKLINKQKNLILLMLSVELAWNHKGRIP